LYKLLLLVSMDKRWCCFIIVFSNSKASQEGVDET
jgi:hypothetical protein